MAYPGPSQRGIMLSVGAGILAAVVLVGLVYALRANG
jgi:hypothetical protein